MHLAPLQHRATLRGVFAQGRDLGAGCPARFVAQVEKKFLFAKNGDVRIAFTKFCPEHATTVHSGESCKAWITRARRQAMGKEKRTAGFEAGQKSYQEKTERAFHSREEERRKQ